MSMSIKGYTTFGKDGKVGSSGCVPERYKASPWTSRDQIAFHSSEP